MSLKKLFGFLTIVILAALLSACGGDKSETSNSEGDEASAESTTDQTETEPSTSEETDSKHPFPEETTPVGESSINVSTPAGSSEDGNVPVLFVGSDAMLIQIGLDYKDFDGSKQTFIYINEKYFETDQFGKRGSTSISLQGELLKPGTYTVTAVQFANDDPASGEVTTLTTAKYEVKKES